MARIDVPFVVEKQHITQPTRETLVSGGQNYFYATFTICDKWDDVYDLKAVFVRENVEKLIDITEGDNGLECQIPWEVMADKGSFQVGIFGGDRLLTDYAFVIVKQGCVVDGETPLPPTPDWFNKIEEELKNSGGGRIIVDQFMSEESENAIANKVITEYVRQVSEDVQGANTQIGLIATDVISIRQQINQHAHFKGYKATNAEILEIEATPNDFAYSAESGTKWIYSEENGWQDSGTPVPDQLTPASETTPLVDGEASVGTENTYARGDHRHPSDPSKVDKTEFNALKSDISNALDAIIDIQNSLIGGDA